MLDGPAVHHYILSTSLASPGAPDIAHRAVLAGRVRAGGLRALPSREFYSPGSGREFYSPGSGRNSTRQDPTENRAGNEGGTTRDLRLRPLIGRRRFRFWRL